MTSCKEERFQVRQEALNERETLEAFAHSEARTDHVGGAVSKLMSQLGDSVHDAPCNLPPHTSK